MSDKQGQQRRGPMARYGRLLTDAQWEKIRPLLPKRRKRPHGGRPPADDRKVLEGILWILRSGARWCDLPVEFPSPSTCWRRLRDWEEQEVWLEIWRTFLSELNERQQLKWSESFMRRNGFWNRGKCFRMKGTPSVGV
jgi:transposase